MHQLVAIAIMNKIFKSLFVFILISNACFGQSIYSSIPKKIDKSARYMFYLHGRIIEDQGIHAIHPEFGSYEYLSILDTLNKYGYNVISEARPKDTDEQNYATKVVKQIDTLLKSGVPPTHIFVVGASKGGYITLLISSKALNKNINFAVLETCSDATNSTKEKIILCGNFLSFFETSDTWCISCIQLFNNQDCIINFQEVQLNTNKKHGVLYKPYTEWVNPLMTWADAVK